jgi:hypothetical protein
MRNLRIACVLPKLLITGVVIIVSTESCIYTPFVIGLGDTTLDLIVY